MGMFAKAYETISVTYSNSMRVYVWCQWVRGSRIFEPSKKIAIKSNQIQTSQLWNILLIESVNSGGIRQINATIQYNILYGVHSFIVISR